MTVHRNKYCKFESRVGHAFFQMALKGRTIREEYYRSVVCLFMNALVRESIRLDFVAWQLPAKLNETL